MKKTRAGLQPPTVNLQKKMTGVGSHLEDTNNTLGKMENRLHSVEDQVKGARTDIDNVRQEINALKEPNKMFPDLSEHELPK